MNILPTILAIDTIDFFIDSRLEILEQVGEHLWLTLVAMTLAIIIAVPLGILIARYDKPRKPVLAIVNLMQTIPSLALLGFLIPIMGIGAVPAITALFFYALLPIVRNTYIGITEIDPSIRATLCRTAPN